MAANDNGTDIVEIEIAKGERDNVFEDYPRLENKRMQNKLCKRILVTKITKRNVPRVSVISTSARIVALTQPMKQRALNKLNKKMMILSPAFVDNLIKIVESKFHLTPKEVAQVYRRKKRRMRKPTQPLSLRKKRMEEIAEDTMPTTTLDHEATMCQYLMAERFVKSILEYRREMRDGVWEIADVIMKHLISIEGYTDAKNSDRTTEQLRFLADVIARWIAEILAEVAETHKNALKEYDRKRRMKRLKMTDDNEMNNKTKNWKQMKMKEKQEEKNDEITKRNNLMKEKSEEEQKRDKTKKTAKKAHELNDREAKDESMRKETVEKEQENREPKKREKEEEGEEVRETKEEEKKGKEVRETKEEEEKKEATMEEQKANRKSSVFKDDTKMI